MRKSCLKKNRLILYDYITILNTDFIKFIFVLIILNRILTFINENYICCLVSILLSYLYYNFFFCELIYRSVQTHDFHENNLPVWKHSIFSQIAYTYIVLVHVNEWFQLTFQKTFQKTPKNDVVSVSCFQIQTFLLQFLLQLLLRVYSKICEHFYEEF